ncbi:NAD(P)-dependent oxidoreductase [Terrarubrum flagellatum]|uniref:NAD(P)-dependent oxidoreductase n=1 Tax=Terrirubrum flagellatum TaxID=2895980 RepID=UPI0031456EB9
MSLAIAFIGYGEVGQLFARELAAKPDLTIAVYDILFEDARKRESLANIARASGVRAGATLQDAIRGADIVISAVTAESAISAARAATEYLAPDQIYIDLNSVSPATKTTIAEAATSRGANFVEFAVMAPVAGTGIATPVLAGGERAEEIAARLNPLGMKIKVASREIGVASATKLCRSIVIKGMEALMVDLSLAGAATGVLPAVLASLSASYPGMDWAQLVATMPSRVTRHGVRRAAEMREAAMMMEENGFNGALLTAIADRHARHAAEAKAAGAQPQTKPEAQPAS